MLSSVHLFLWNHRLRLSLAKCTLTVHRPVRAHVLCPLIGKSPRSVLFSCLKACAAAGHDVCCFGTGAELRNMRGRTGAMRTEP